MLHLVLRYAVQASRRRWRADIRVAAEAVGTVEVGAQAFDVELGDDAPRRGNVEAARDWRRAREDPQVTVVPRAFEDPQGAHPAWGEQRARREGRVPRGEQHRLASVLPLLQQCPHLGRHAPHQVRSRLARPRSFGGEVPAAVSVKGRVAGPEGRLKVADRELTIGTRAGRSSARSLAKERRMSAMTPLTRWTLLMVL